MIRALIKNVLDLDSLSCEERAQLLVICLISLLILILCIPKRKSKRDANAIAAGRLGESEVAQRLNELPKEEYIVFNDLLLPFGKSVAQIDHLVLSRYGIFVIETKNYSGVLYGNESDRYVRYAVGTFKKQIYNPLKQNRTHTLCILKSLGLRESPAIIPILAVADRCHCNIKTNGVVVKFSRLAPTIYRYNKIYFSRRRIERMARTIKKLNITDPRKRKKLQEGYYSSKYQ